MSFFLTDEPPYCSNPRRTPLFSKNGQQAQRALHPLRTYVKEHTVSAQDCDVNIQLRFEHPDVACLYSFMY